MVRMIETTRKRTSVPTSSLGTARTNQPQEGPAMENSSEIESSSPSSYTSSNGRLSRSNSKSEDARSQQPPQPLPIELRDIIRAGRRIPASYQIREALEFAQKKTDREFIMEVQFNGAPGQYHHDNNWTILMDPPPFAKRELVQEFYANFS